MADNASNNNADNVDVLPVDGNNNNNNQPPASAQPPGGNTQGAPAGGHSGNVQHPSPWAVQQQYSMAPHVAPPPHGYYMYHPGYYQPPFHAPHQQLSGHHFQPQAYSQYPQAHFQPPPPQHFQQQAQPGHQPPQLNEADKDMQQARPPQPPQPHTPAQAAMSDVAGMYNVPIHPRFLQAMDQAVSQDAEATLVATGAASASFAAMINPSNQVAFLLGDVLEARKWARCMHGNPFAVISMVQLLTQYFSSVLQGPLSTQHLLWSSLQHHLVVAARFPIVASDPNFCESANLLMRELYIDLSAKSGTPASALQTMRETARLDQVPEMFTQMNKAAADRIKMKKGE
jgi:hypothetical protein